LINEESARLLEYKFREEVQTHCTEAVWICVGCKEDLRTEAQQGLISATPIDSQSGELLAKRLKCLCYLETSGNTGYGLGSNFIELMLQSHIYNNYLRKQKTHNKKSKKCSIC
jgi:hypothetical protein